MSATVCPSNDCPNDVSALCANLEKAIDKQHSSLNAIRYVTSQGKIFLCNDAPLSAKPS